MKETKCPFCKRLMLLDDQARRTLHIAPICEQWAEYCEQSGAEFEGELVVERKDRRS